MVRRIFKPVLVTVGVAAAAFIVVPSLPFNSAPAAKSQTFGCQEPISGGASFNLPTEPLPIVLPTLPSIPPLEDLIPEIPCPELPDLTDISIPDISIPDISIPDVSIPDIHDLIPDISIPPIPLPCFEQPPSDSNVQAALTCQELEHASAD